MSHHERRDSVIGAISRPRSPLTVVPASEADRESLSSCFLASVALREGIAHLKATQQIQHAVIGGTAIAAYLRIIRFVSYQHHPNPRSATAELNFNNHSFGRFTKDVDVDMISKTWSVEKLWDELTKIGAQGIALPNVHREVTPFDPIERETDHVKHTRNAEIHSIPLHGYGVFYSSQNHGHLYWKPQSPHHGNIVPFDVRTAENKLLRFLPNSDAPKLYGPTMARVVEVADRHGHLIGELQTFEPWLLVLVKLNAFTHRTSGSPKDLLDVRMLLEARYEQRLQLHLTEEDFTRHWAHLDPEKAEAFQRLESEYIQRARGDALISELAGWELQTVSHQLSQAGLLRDGHPIAKESAQEWEQYKSYEQTEALAELRKRWRSCLTTILVILSQAFAAARSSPSAIAPPAFDGEVWTSDEEAEDPGVQAEVGGGGLLMVEEELEMLERAGNVSKSYRA